MATVLLALPLGLLVGFIASKSASTADAQTSPEPQETNANPADFSAIAHPAPRASSTHLTTIAPSGVSRSTERSLPQSPWTPSSASPNAEPRPMSSIPAAAAGAGYPHPVAESQQRLAQNALQSLSDLVSSADAAGLNESSPRATGDSGVNSALPLPPASGVGAAPNSTNSPAAAAPDFGWRLLAQLAVRSAGSAASLGAALESDGPIIPSDAWSAMTKSLAEETISDKGLLVAGTAKAWTHENQILRLTLIDEMKALATIKSASISFTNDSILEWYLAPQFATANTNVAMLFSRVLSANPTAVPQDGWSAMGTSLGAETLNDHGLLKDVQASVWSAEEEKLRLDLIEALLVVAPDGARQTLQAALVSLATSQSLAKN